MSPRSADTFSQVRPLRPLRSRPPAAHCALLLGATRRKINFLLDKWCPNLNYLKLMISMFKKKIIVWNFRNGKFVFKAFVMSRKFWTRRFFVTSSSPAASLAWLSSGTWMPCCIQWRPHWTLMMFLASQSWVSILPLSQMSSLSMTNLWATTTMAWSSSEKFDYILNLNLSLIFD